jgi:hypothetical protein
MIPFFQKPVRTHTATRRDQERRATAPRWSDALLPISILVLASLLPTVAIAHRPHEAYLFLRYEEDSLELRVEATLGDLSKALPLDDDGDGEISDAEYQTHHDEIREYFLDHVAIGLGSTNWKLTEKSNDVRTHSFGRFVWIVFDVDAPPEIPDQIEAEYRLFFDSIPDHRGFLVIERNTKTGVDDNEAIPSLLFTPETPRQTTDLTQPLGIAGFRAFVKHGVWHIWIGFDHVLFLLLLVMTSVLERRGSGWKPAGSFSTALLNVATVITLFTVAHTITLSLAALGVINLSPRWVESAIALSVVLVAANNVRPFFGNRTWAVVFGFGFFHGIGFANVLGYLTQTREALVKTLIGFNVGVEIGQLAIIVVAFPLLYLIREQDAYRKYLMPGASVVIGLIALVWFVERAFGAG